MNVLLFTNLLSRNASEHYQLVMSTLTTAKYAYLQQKTGKVRQRRVNTALSALHFCIWKGGTMREKEGEMHQPNGWCEDAMSRATTSPTS
jgi:putative hemolysin